MRVLHFAVELTGQKNPGKSKDQRMPSEQAKARYSFPPEAKELR
jgi:hypothetical protein